MNWKTCVFDAMTARNGQEEEICGAELALQRGRTAMINSLGEK